MITFIPWTSYHTPTSRNLWVVGCGGVGARLVPLLVKVLRQGDTLHLIDHDTVGEENLNRQHFGPNDVGKYKAEVLANRYFTTNGPQIRVFTQPIAEVLNHIYPMMDLGSGQFVMMFGAVDNHDARRTMHDWATNHTGIYIDMGCALRTGQALISGTMVGKIMVNQDYMGWGLVPSPTDATKRITGLVPSPEADLGLGLTTVFRGIQELYPNILEADATEQVGCAMRMDTQSVISNQLAATFGFNLGLWFMQGIRVPSVGTTFSATAAVAQAHTIQHVVVKSRQDDRIYLFATEEAATALGGFKLTSRLG